MADAERSILVVVHAHRDESVQAARRVIAAITAAGAQPVLDAAQPGLLYVATVHGRWQLRRAAAGW